MNIFQKIAFINRVSKAYKKSKKHLDNIIGEIQELVRLLPDFRNIYFEVIEIIENIK